MLYRISVTERGLTGIANIFRSRLSKWDDLLGAGSVPLKYFDPGFRPVSFFIELKCFLCKVTKYFDA